MSKLKMPFTRCMLHAPRALAGLGVVAGMEQPLCGGLCRDTESDREAHLKDLHHGAKEGKWESVVDEETYTTRRRHTCDCGSPSVTFYARVPICGTCKERMAEGAHVVTTSRYPGDYTKEERLVVTRAAYKRRKRANDNPAR